MARIDDAPDERGKVAGLTLEQIRECPEPDCGDEDVEVIFFVPGVEDFEDIEEADAIKAEATCSNGHTHEYQYNGWTVHGDAG